MRVRVVTKNGAIVVGTIRRSIIGFFYLVEYSPSSGVLGALSDALTGSCIAKWYPRWQIVEWVSDEEVV